MITIEQVLEVLKKDHNFRDIIDQDNYYYSWTGVTFDHLSYDSRDVTPSSLFFAKGAAFKPEFLENAVKAGLSFYVAEKDYSSWEIPAIYRIRYQAGYEPLLLRPSTNTLKTSLNCWLLLGQKGKLQQPTLPSIFSSKVINLLCFQP